MSAIYTHQLIVPQSAIDENGHVNNIEYLRWMQDAATAHATAVGGTLATQNIDATWVARSHHIEYLRPAFANEHLIVHTWISNVGRARSLRKYKITRDDILISRGETDWVLIDVVTGRPRTIPKEISKCFTLVPEESEP